LTTSLIFGQGYRACRSFQSLGSNSSQNYVQFQNGQWSSLSSESSIRTDPSPTTSWRSRIEAESGPLQSPLSYRQPFAPTTASLSTASFDQAMHSSAHSLRPMEAHNNLLSTLLPSQATKEVLMC